MTDKQLARIKRPSKLIRIGLKDLAKVERSKTLKVDMGVWVSDCAVCFAGSVMVKSLSGDPDGSLNPHALSRRNSFAL